MAAAWEAAQQDAEMTSACGGNGTGGDEAGRLAPAGFTAIYGSMLPYEAYFYYLEREAGLRELMP